MRKLNDPLISTILITFCTSALLLSLKKILLYSLFISKVSRYIARILFYIYGDGLFPLFYYGLLV